MKSKRLSRRLLLGVVLLASAVRLWAQDTVSIEFSAVTWGAEPSDVFYRTTGKIIPLTVPHLTAKSNQVFAYTGPANLELLRKSTSETGVITYNTAGTVRLPPASRRVLLLFTPPPLETGQTQTLSAIALPDDPENFANGKIRLTNCTPARLAIKCNTQVVELPPGESRIITPDSNQIMLELAAWDGASWRMIANNFLTFPTDSRLNAFVYLGGRLGETAPRPDPADRTITARDFSIITLADAAPL
ncbi:MAG: hypothetical protein WC205_09310 [Opitutaceae bacterium]|jgi:hypothetical protein